MLHGGVFYPAASGGYISYQRKYCHIRSFSENRRYRRKKQNAEHASAKVVNFSQRLKVSSGHSRNLYQPIVTYMKDGQLLCVRSRTWYGNNKILQLEGQLAEIYFPADDPEGFRFSDRQWEPSGKIIFMIVGIPFMLVGIYMVYMIIHYYGSWILGLF